jgi:1-acyl-sn-glycerol-3-phosphate acyltransferase
MAHAGVPVVPVAVRGARSALREGTWSFRRAAVAVNFAPAVQPAGSDWSAVLKLRDEVRAEILKRCGESDLASI